MRILGLDTATRATVAALLDTDLGLELEARDDPPPGVRPRHGERLLALAAEVLAQAGIGWGDLDLIAVGLGPGTFTGLRIGVATARGLAQAHGTALSGVGTLESLALAAAARRAPSDDHRQSPRDGHGVVVPVLDARRREVFAAAWCGPLADPDPRAWETVIEPTAIAPQALAERLAALAAETPLAVGEGALLAREALEHAGAEMPAEERLHRVSALAHCRLAASCEPQAPEEVLPRYLRVPDAELALRAS